jgi:hypothetical protein
MGHQSNVRLLAVRANVRLGWKRHGINYARTMFNRAYTWVSTFKKLLFN